MMSSATNRPERAGRPVPGSLGEPSSPRPDVVSRARVRGNDRRGHQQPRRCPPSDRLSALRAEARHPQGAPRHVDRGGRPAAHRPRTPGRRFGVRGARPEEARRFRWSASTAINQRTNDVTSPWARPGPTPQQPSSHRDSTAARLRARNRARPRAQQITREACRKTTRWTSSTSHGPRGLPTLVVDRNWPPRSTRSGSPPPSSNNRRDIPGSRSVADTDQRFEDSNPQPSDVRGTDLRPGDLVHEGRLPRPNGNPTGSSSGLPGGSDEVEGEHSRLGRWRVPTRQSSCSA